MNTLLHSPSTREFLHSPSTMDMQRSGDRGISPSERSSAQAAAAAQDFGLKMLEGAMNNCRKSHKEEINELRSQNAMQIQNLKDFFREELRKIHQEKHDDRLYFKSQVGSHILPATF
jgi:hypothetical protein